LCALVEDFPHTYRDEMADFLAEESEVSVSLDTVSRALKDAGFISEEGTPFPQP
jgi:hypothetical protein